MNAEAKDLAAFLAGIAAELIKLGEQLFQAHDGDLHKARYELADRRAEIASNRVRRDQADKDKP